MKTLILILLSILSLQHVSFAQVSRPDLGEGTYGVT
jgi:hypothetical protein